MNDDFDKTPSGRNPFEHEDYGQDPYRQDPYRQDPYGHDGYGQDSYRQNPFEQDSFASRESGEELWGYAGKPAGIIKKYPVVMIAMALINAALFIFPDLFKLPCSLDELLFYGALFGPAVSGGQYYRLLTAAFLHFSIDHMMNNMFIAAALGWRLESIVGHVKYFVIYMVSAVGANIVSLIWYTRTSPLTLSAGASGAVFGIIGGMLGVTLRNKFDASRRSRRPDMRGAHDHKEADITDLTPRSMAIYAVLSIYVGYVSAGVNNIAHISGLIFGFLLGFAMYSRYEKSR